jgi:hypothetical protein
MALRRNPPSGSRIAASNDIGRRDLIMGGLLAAASLMVSTKGWAQAGPVVPLHCVPPVPPGQASMFARSDSHFDGLLWWL